MSTTDLVLESAATTHRDQVLGGSARTEAQAALAGSRQAVLYTPAPTEVQATSWRSLRHLRGCFFIETLVEQVTLSDFSIREGTLTGAHRAALAQALVRAEQFLADSRPLARVRYDLPYLVGAETLASHPDAARVPSFRPRRDGLADRSPQRALEQDWDAFRVHSAVVLDRDPNRAELHEPRAWIEAIEGHASQTGPERDNDEYSRQRAASVVDYLTRRLGGNRTSAVEVRGEPAALGSTQPAVDLPGIERAENRRATFRLVRSRCVAHIPTADEFERVYRARVREVAGWASEQPENIDLLVRHYEGSLHPDREVNINFARHLLQEKLVLAYNAAALVEDLRRDGALALPRKRYSALSASASMEPGNWVENPLHRYIDGEEGRVEPLPPGRRVVRALAALKGWDRVMAAVHSEISGSASAAIHRWVALQEEARSSMVTQYSLNLRRVPFQTYVAYLEKTQRGNWAENRINDLVDWLWKGNTNILKHEDTTARNRHFLEDEALRSRAADFVERHF